MKKVFLSVPMKGRTKEQIEQSINKIKEITQAFCKGEDIEFINTIVQDRPPYETDESHTAIWYLGKSLELLSECDLLVTLDCHYEFNGCDVECQVARRYGIEVLSLPTEFVAKDLIEILNRENSIYYKCNC